MSSDCSVVIPTADRGELLDRSILSVVRQAIRPDEIVVVDNGRADASIDAELAKSVRVLRTAPRIGPGKARNLGAWSTSTQWVAFLDDDDLWEPDYLAESLRVLEDTGADVVVGQLKRRRVNGPDEPYKMFPPDPAGQRGIYYRNPGFGGQNFIIRRDLFMELGGFDELMPASVDRDLAARLLQRGARIAVAPRSIAVLCDHDGSRVRQNQVAGNRLFIKKHWRHMTVTELLRATTVYIRRYVSVNWFGGRIR